MGNHHFDSARIYVKYQSSKPIDFTLPRTADTVSQIASGRCAQNDGE